MVLDAGSGGCGGEAGISRDAGVGIDLEDAWRAVFVEADVDAAVAGEPAGRPCTARDLLQLVVQRGFTAVEEDANRVAIGEGTLVPFRLPAQDPWAIGWKVEVGHLGKRQDLETGSVRQQRDVELAARQQVLDEHGLAGEKASKLTGAIQRPPAVRSDCAVVEPEGRVLESWLEDPRRRHAVENLRSVGVEQSAGGHRHPAAREGAARRLLVGGGADRCGRGSGDAESQALEGRSRVHLEAGAPGRRLDEIDDGVGAVDRSGIDTAIVDCQDAVRRFEGCESGGYEADLGEYVLRREVVAGCDCVMGNQDGAHGSSSYLSLAAVTISPRSSS